MISLIYMEHLILKKRKRSFRQELLFFGALVGIVNDYIDQVPDSKTKNKVLAQVVSFRKELRRIFDEVEAYKGASIKVEKVLDGISSCESFLSGNDIISLVGLADKRYLGLVYANSRILEQAAHDGDVEISEDVARKIIKKSFDLLIGDNPTRLTEGVANDILINEII